MIKLLCVIFEFTLNSIIITFLYTNIYIVYNFHKYLNSLIMLSILKFSFYYLLIIKYNLALFLILKVFVSKRFFFISINIFSIIPFFKLNLHFVFKKFLIFLINVIIIIFVSSLFINAIIFFF